MSLSVVIPAHNAGTFIDEAIGSVLAQDWPVESIIVVNDGSTDRDYGQLRALAPQVQVIDQPNRGVSAARNRGCALVTSDYIALLDADDVWVPGKLRAQMRHLAADPTCDAVFCLGAWWHRNADGTWPPAAQVVGPVPEDATIKRLDYSDFVFALPGAGSTMVIKREVWRAIGGFDERRRHAEDIEFNLRLARRHRIDVVNAAGMLYRQHPTSATHRLLDANHWADVIAQAAGSAAPSGGDRDSVDPARLRRRLSELHMFHGRDHFWHGDAQVARREFRRALSNRPWAAKTAAYLLLASLPGLPQLLRRAASLRQQQASD